MKPAIRRNAPTHSTAIAGPPQINTRWTRASMRSPEKSWPTLALPRPAGGKGLIRPADDGSGQGGRIGRRRPRRALAVPAQGQRVPPRQRRPERLPPRVAEEERDL